VSDPFDTLGIAPTFDLDLAALESRHRELSRALHPDRYSGRPPGERRMALSRAIEVNEALRALKNPVRRAESLLARRGVAFAEGDEPRADPAFLMEMLELGEELAAARSDLERATQIGDRLETRQAALLGRLSAAFAALDAAGALAAQSERVLEISRGLGELRYYGRLLGEARAIQDEIG